MITRSLIIKGTVMFALIALLASNVVIFARSMYISDQITHLETEIREIEKENARLEQEVYAQNSLNNLSELAEQLGFTKEAQPIFLETNEYALVQ